MKKTFCDIGFLTGYMNHIKCLKIDLHCLRNGQSHHDFCMFFSVITYFTVGHFTMFKTVPYVLPNQRMVKCSYYPVTLIQSFITNPSGGIVPWSMIHKNVALISSNNDVIA